MAEPDFLPREYCKAEGVFVHQNASKRNMHRPQRADTYTCQRIFMKTFLFRPNSIYLQRKKEGERL